MDGILGFWLQCNSAFAIVAIWGVKQHMEVHTLSLFDIQVNQSFKNATGQTTHTHTIYMHAIIYTGLFT